MSRLIDADALIENIKNDPVGKILLVHYNLDGFIKSQPTIDAEPVKRGMWTFIRLTDKDWGHKAKECSSCGSTFFNTTLWDFCPNCGARMDKDD